MQINEALVDLLGGIAVQGHIHLAELQRDGAQAEQLLISAFGRLGEHCTRLCSVVASGANGPLSDSEQLTGITREIVTDLQVHDMVHQVLQRSLLRIRGVGELLDQIQQICTELEGAAPQDAANAENVTRAALGMLTASTELSAQLPRRVEQTSSDAGDVLLF